MSASAHNKKWNCSSCPSDGLLGYGHGDHRYHHARHICMTRWNKPWEPRGPTRPFLGQALSKGHRGRLKNRNSVYAESSNLSRAQPSSLRPCRRDAPGGRGRKSVTATTHNIGFSQAEPEPQRKARTSAAVRPPTHAQHAFAQGWTGRELANLENTRAKSICFFVSSVFPPYACVSRAATLTGDGLGNFGRDHHKFVRPNVTVPETSS